jgi:hypothetical protein
MNLTRMRSLWIVLPAAAIIAGGGTAFGLTAADHPAVGRPSQPTPTPSESKPTPTPVPTPSEAQPTPTPVPTSSGRA